MDYFPYIIGDIVLLGIFLFKAFIAYVFIKAWVLDTVIALKQKIKQRFFDTE